MTGDDFRLCVEALAAAIDGDSKGVEEALDAYEQALKAFPPERRRNIRNQIISIVSGLARLERRMAENEKRNQ